MEKERLAEAIEKLNAIANTIYKGEITQGMADMAGVIPTLAEVAGELSEEQQDAFVNDALKPALEAMEDNDGTMIADIISYEIVPMLEQL